MYGSIFYNVFQNEVCFSEYVGGKRDVVKEPWVPYFYAQTRSGEKDAESLGGVPVVKVESKSFFEYCGKKKEFEKTYEADVPPEVQYLLDRYKGLDLSENPPRLRVAYLDIEVEIESSFPSPSLADEKINLIALYDSWHEKTYVFGLGKYTSEDSSVVYTRCPSEEALLRTFVGCFHSLWPDIVTGWNITSFDIPYLINRCNKVIGEKETRKLSKIGVLTKRNQRTEMGEVETYEIGLTTVLDYMDLYKHFSVGGRESFSLNYISEYELKTGKVKYDSSYRDLYLRDWKKFVEYNVTDVDLVRKLDKKLGFIDLTVTLAYLCKIPFDLVFTTLKKTDAVLLSYLKLEGKTLADTPESPTDTRVLPGGFVMNPDRGKHSWVSCFDVVSLYPNLMMLLNVSPEVKITKIPVEVAEKIIGGSSDDKKANEIRDRISKNGWLLAANGAIFQSKKKQLGIIPRALEDFYRRRIEYKKRKAEAQKTGDPNLVRYDMIQYALKIVMNSIYGYMANQFCKLYDIDCAEAITLSGQMFLKNAIQTCEDWNTKNESVLAEKLLKGVTPPAGSLVKACDTDSLFIHVGRYVHSALSEDFKEKVVRKLNSLVFGVIEEANETLARKLGATTNIVHFELDNTAKAIIFLTKKRYISLREEDGKDKFTVKGIEIVRSSTPHAVRDYLRQVCIEVLRGKEYAEVTKQVQEIFKEYEKLPLEKAACPTSVNGLNKYKLKSGRWEKGTPIHVKAALLYNYLLDSMSLTGKYEKILDGGKMKYAYLKTNAVVKNNTIGFTDSGLPEEFGLTPHIDYEKMFDKNFLKPLSPIFEVLGWAIPSVAMQEIESLFS